MSIKTRLIDYRDSDLVFEGKLAWDDAIEGPRPGVLVAHTIRGRSKFEEGKAELLAGMGYAGFAIDVYGKDAIGSGFDDCREMMESLRNQRALLQRRLLRALRALRDQAEVDAARVAAIGYCFGGLCALGQYGRQSGPGPHPRPARLGRSAGYAGTGGGARRGAQQHGGGLATALLR